MRRISSFCQIALVAAALLCVVQAGAEDKTYQVYGTVTYPDGTPAAGVTVKVQWNCTENETTTDANGAYEYAFPATADYVGVDALKGDYLASEGVGVPADVKAPIRKDLVLEYACLVLGEVTDASTGAPIANADVAIYGSYGVELKSTSDGTFKIRAPRRDGLELNVRKEGYVLKIIRFSAEDQDVVAWRVPLKPGGIVRGMVTDDSGNPMAGICVNVSETGMNSVSVKTDGNGHYEAHGIDPDVPATVATGGSNTISRAQIKAIFPPGSTEAVGNLAVHRLVPRSITGRTTDDSGAPVQGAKVILGTTTFGGIDKTTTTDEKGEYRFDAVKPQANTIVVQKEGFAPAFMRVEEAGDQQLDATLQKGHSAEVLLVDSLQRPIPDVQVAVCAKTTALPWDDENRSWRGLYKTVTDSTGRALLNDLPPDGVSLEIWKNDYAAPKSIPIQVDSADNVVKMLGSPDVAGTVVDAATGAPISRFTVSSGYHFRDNSTFSRRDGKFHFFPWSSRDSGPDPRPYPVKILADGYLGEVTRITSTNLPTIDYAHVIKLQKAPPLTGKIVDASGNGIAGVKVTVIEKDSYDWTWPPSLDRVGYQQKATTAADGSFTAGTAREKVASLLLEKPGGEQLFFHYIDLTKPLNLAMLGPATLRIKATGMAGDNAKVHLLAEMESGSHFLGSAGIPDQKIDSRGLATLTDIQPEYYRLHIVGDRYEKWRNITIRSGDNLLLDMDRPMPVMVKGVVTQGGIPAAGMRVTIIRGETYGHVESDACVTDSGGRYSIRLEQPGLVRLELSKSRSDPPLHQERVNLKPGVTTINLKAPLPPTGSMSGRVIDAKTGKSVAGKQVEAWWTPPRPLSRKQLPQSGKPEQGYVASSIVSGENGSFSLKGIPGGRVSVVVRDSSGALQYAGKPMVLQEKQPVKGLQVRLEEPGALELATIDSKTGMPVGSKNARLFASNGVLAADVGSSSPVIAPPGDYIVRVEPSDDKHDPGWANVSIKGGRTAKVVMKLSATHSRMVAKEPKRAKPNR